MTEPFDATETMLRMMALPAIYQAVCRTSDGHYVAMAHGDIGYNEFFGQPAPVHPGPANDQMNRIWSGLTDSERHRVLAVAANPDGPVRLEEDFGVPIQAWRDA